MIEKIVSGGQTGADRAALDAAIALGIDHGGWVPKGRKTENGPLPDSYQLKEMASSAYKDRTIQNVIDSDGTLIVTRGPLTGGSITTQKATEMNDKPCLHINLNLTPAFSGITKTTEWVFSNQIKVLNVAGPRASKDPLIYDDVKKMIEGIIYLCSMKQNPALTSSLGFFSEENPLVSHPATIEAAVDQLIASMPLKDKATVANMTEREVLLLDTTLGRYISEKLDIWEMNRAFIASYIHSTGKVYLRDDARITVLLELWQKLKSTHKLRVVK